MKNAIILHGMPSRSEYEKSDNWIENQHWIPWLAAELKKNGIETYYPEMPEPYAPVYEKWKEVFEQFSVDEKTILVGHSCGGGFLVRWLSENKTKVGKVILVAPWIDPNRNRAPRMFAHLQIDPTITERTAGITGFISLDDGQEELTTLEVLKSKIRSLKVIEFIDKGHFTRGDMGTNEFPELRDFLLS